LGIGGGIITKKLLFVVFLIASLSLSGVTSASAVDTETAQKQISDTNIINKNENIQTENNNTSINSATTQETADEDTKSVETTQSSYDSKDEDQIISKTLTENTANTVSTSNAKTTDTSESIEKAETADTKASDQTVNNPSKVNDETAEIPEAAAGETETANTTTTIQTSFTVADVQDASSRVKSYIETNKRLPKYVTIGTIQVKMPDFLQLLTAGLLQLNSGPNNPITLKTVNNATTPTETIKSGTLTKASYLDLAKRVNAFINANGKLPNYTTSSLGKMGYQSLIYMFSKVLNFEKTNNRLPSYVSVKPWSAVGTSSSSGTISTPVPADLQKYLAATANCQVNDPRIKALAASITAGKTTTYAKAAAIFNWVRNNLSYSFYYNTKYGAVGALNAKTGNCVDTSHLVIALSRAAGIPARYEHVKAQFTSGNWYGHVIAQIWVDGKWYYADASSNYNTFGVINNWKTSTATIKGYYASLPF